MDIIGRQQNNVALFGVGIATRKPLYPIHEVRGGYDNINEVSTATSSATTPNVFYSFYSQNFINNINNKNTKNNHSTLLLRAINLLILLAIGSAGLKINS